MTDDISIRGKGAKDSLTNDRFDLCAAVILVIDSTQRHLLNARNVHVECHHQDRARAIHSQ
jgi:hypothetical protein